MPTTIYILGNLQTFVAALTGIQMIFNPANNTDWAAGGALFGVGPIVTIGLLVSLLHITTKGVWTQKLSIHHVGILLGLYAAMFIPTTNVTVQDLYTGQSQIVDGIPIGVAYPASIVSQLSYDAATQLGQAFQTVSATQPPTNIATGMAAPLRTMLQLRNMYMFFSKEQPGLARAEVLFVKQCVYPNAAYNNWWQQINQSSNILNTYAGFSYPANATSQVPYDATLAASGANITCTAGGSCSGKCGDMAVAVDAAFQKWLGNNQSSGLGCSNAAGMSTSANAESTTPTADCTGAGSFGSILSAMGTSGSEYISMIVNSCINSAGMAAGPDVNALPQTSGQNNDYCTIMTNSMSQAQVDNAGSSNVFLANMLPLMSILQFLFIALAPLAAFTMVMAAEAGVQTFIKYIMFGLWTQSWLPVAAIINDYAQITVEHQFTVLAAAATASAGSVGAAMTNALNSIPAVAAGQDALTTTSLPILIQQTMQVLSNADMMLAMTPIITMIVFTGSYFGMAQLAQGVGGEDNVSKNTGLTTPGLSAEEKAFGTSSPGNSRGVFVNLDSAYSGVGGEVSQSMQSAVSAASAQVQTATASATQALSASTTATFTAMESAGNAQVASTSAKVQGGHKVEEAFNSLQGLQHDTGISVDKMVSSQIAYQAAIDAGNEGLAQTILTGLTKGLNAQQANKISHDIKSGEVLKWSKDLSSKEAADLVTAMSKSNDSKISHQTADQVNHAVANSEKAEIQKQDALANQAKVEKTASQVMATAGKEKMDQATISSWFASRKQQLTAQAAENLAQAGGGQAAVDQLRKNEAHIQNTTGDTGEALYAAALGLLSAQSQDATFGMAAVMYGGGMGRNAAQTFQARESAAQQQIDRTGAALKPDQDLLDKQPPTDFSAVAGRASQAGQAADPGKVSAAARQAPPTYVAYRDPGTFFGSEAKNVAAHGKEIAFDKEAKDNAGYIDNAPGMNLTQLAADHPELFVKAIAAANTVGSVIKTLSKPKKAVPPGEGKGEPEKGAPGEPTPAEPGATPAEPGAAPAEPGAAPAEPGAAPAPAEPGATPAEPPAPQTPAQKQLAARQAAQAELDGRGPVSPISPGGTPAEQQVTARQTAQAQLGEGPGPTSRLPDTPSATATGEKVLATRAEVQAADMAASKELTDAFVKAGAKFVSNTASQQQLVAAAAEAGPAGDVIAIAAEGGIVLLNADAAADVIQAGYALVQKEGLSAATRQAIEATTTAVNSAMTSANARAAISRAAVDQQLGLPPSPKE